MEQEQMQAAAMPNIEPVVQIQMVENVEESVVATDSADLEGTIEILDIKVSEMILIQDTWTSTVLAKLYEMCNEGMFCDMSLVSTNGVKVPCHTSVMVASCSYFHKLLTALNQSYANAQMSIHVSLDDSVIKMVLAFIYTGKVRVSSTVLPQLANAARFLDVPVLRQLCENAMKGLEPKIKEASEMKIVQEVIEDDDPSKNPGTEQMVPGEQCVVQVEQEDGEVVEHAVILQPDGGVVEEEDNTESPIIEGTFEIEGTVEADTAEVLSALARQGALTVQMPQERNTSRSDVSTWDKVFICMYCNRTFRRKDLLQSHERVHTGDRPFQCPHCPKSFKQKPHLIEHVRQHTGEKPYHCKVCDRRFAYYSHFNKHKQTHAEGGRKAFVCQYCEKTFLSPLSFAAHEREHRGEKPFRCTDCDQAFTLRSKLIDHQRIEHGMHSALQCQHCPKRFANLSHLKEHERIHTGERPFVCGNCNKGFKTKSTLVKHIETHMTERPYKCEICDKSYVRESVLIEHKRTHTGERPYTCQYCDMSFTRQSTLCNHMKIHTVGRQYRCDICSASFVRKDDCIKHVMRRHPSGKRHPHACDICHKLFQTLNKVKRHKQRKHGLAKLGTSVNKTAQKADGQEGEGQFMYTVKKEPLSDADSDDTSSGEEEEVEIVQEVVEAEMEVAVAGDQEVQLVGEETVIITEVPMEAEGNGEEIEEDGEGNVVHTFHLKEEEGQVEEVE